MLDNSELAVNKSKSADAFTGARICRNGLDRTRIAVGSGYGAVAVVHVIAA